MSNVNNETIYHQLIVNLGGINKVFISELNLLDSERGTKNKIVKEAVKMVVKKVFNDSLSDEYKRELKKDFYKKIEFCYGSTINNFLEFHNAYSYIELTPVKKIERKKESIEVFTSINKTEILEGEKFKKVYDMDLYICKEVIDKENNFIRYYLVDKNNKMILFSGSVKKRLIERLNDFLEEYTEKEIKSLIEKFLIKVGQKEKECVKMYKISFETDRVNKKVRNWEDKLFNDFHKALNTISYKYKTKTKALERLNFIINGYSKVADNKDSYVVLKDKKYGRQKLAIKLWGIPQGYVKIDSKLLQAEKEGIIKIKLSDFYDIRQNSKILKNAYLVIEYCN